MINQNVEHKYINSFVNLEVVLFSDDRNSHNRVVARLFTWKAITSFVNDPKVGIKR